MATVCLHVKNNYSSDAIYLTHKKIFPILHPVVSANRELYLLSINGVQMIRHTKPTSVPQSKAPYSQIVRGQIYAYFESIVATDFPEKFLLILIA